jgi:mannose-6-phosphate isomerase-like protein (cupin superfamily)
MHSLNQAVMGNVVATERADRAMIRAVKPGRPERPPSVAVRGRVAYATGRVARRLDREMARRAVAEVCEPGGRHARPPIPSSAVEKVRLEDREPFVSADGSSIRELAGIPSGNAVNQSLAEATVPVGGETVEHFHRIAEEIYLFTSGAGRMRLGADEVGVRAGDTVVIAPGVRHKLFNPGPEPLVLLCCCAPAYSHDDTVLLEGG